LYFISLFASLNYASQQTWLIYERRSLYFFSLCYIKWPSKNVNPRTNFEQVSHSKTRGLILRYRCCLAKLLFKFSVSCIDPLETVHTVREGYMSCIENSSLEPTWLAKISRDQADHRLLIHQKTRKDCSGSRVKAIPGPLMIWWRSCSSVTEQYGECFISLGIAKLVHVMYHMS
jgi:hypothetical protein